MTQTVDYDKTGLLVVRDNTILLCRKRSLTSKLILPGGCIEAGESPLDCLRREVREELGEVIVENLEYIATYSDAAASDDPSVRKTVQIRLYRGEIVGEPVASSEIVELVWFGADSDRNQLSPILVNKILPDLIDRNILSWSRQ